MKLLIYTLPGDDDLIPARHVLATEILQPIRSLDDADAILVKHFGEGAEIITYQDLTESQLIALPSTITALP